MSVIPKVCSTDHWWSARLAEVVRESLYKSMIVLCGPPNDSKWSAHRKSLGITDLNVTKI